MGVKRTIKTLLSASLSTVFRILRPLREGFRRLGAHASLSAELPVPLPASTVILGRVFTYGSRNIHLGENVLLYPDLHLETQGDARIEIGDNVVISRGAHIVAMSGITIGNGSMIGEYTSIRDANHQREESRSIRESGYAAAPIVLGEEVWIGRGVAVLGGVTIGRKATVGANAVVTKDVAAETTVGGVPASPLVRRKP